MFKKEKKEVIEFPNGSEVELKVVGDKPEFPKEGSRGSGTTHAYSVEARLNYKDPAEFGGVIYHKEWQRIRFDKAAVGVPNQLCCKRAEELGLLTYQAAQALRWWFHASVDRVASCFETRILKHKVTYSYEETVVSAHHHIGSEDRSAIMPDWNK